MQQEVQITFTLSADAELSKQDITNLFNELINENTPNTTAYKRMLIPRIEVSNVLEESEIYNTDDSLKTAFDWMINGTELVLTHPDDHNKYGEGYTNESVFKVDKILSSGQIDIYNVDSMDVLIEIDLHEVKPKN